MQCRFLAYAKHRLVARLQDLGQAPINPTRSTALPCKTCRLGYTPCEGEEEEQDAIRRDRWEIEASPELNFRIASRMIANPSTGPAPDPHLSHTHGILGSPRSEHSKEWQAHSRSQKVGQETGSNQVHGTATAATCLLLRSAEC